MRNAGDMAPGGAAGRRNQISGQEPPAGGGPGSSVFTPAYRADRDPGQFGGGAGRIGAGEYGHGEYGAGDYGAGEYDSRHHDTGQYDTGAHSRMGGGLPAHGGPRLSPSGEPDWIDGYEPARYGSPEQRTDSDGPSASRAIRGFAPLPGDPLPVYPPGPFEAWNRGAASASPSSPGRPEPSRDQEPGRASWPGQVAATITPDDFDTNHSMPAIKDPILGAPDRGRADSQRRPGTGRDLDPARGRGTERTGPDWIMAGSQEDRGPRTGGRDRSGQSQRQRTAGQRGKPGGSRADSTRRGGASRAAAQARRQPVIVAVGAAVLIIVIVAVILFFLAGGSPGNTPAKAGLNPSASSRTSASPAATPTPSGQWQFIGSRTTDPAPLTMPELFPARFTSGAATYAQVAEVASTDCASALIGGVLQNAVKQAGCTQALRATYLSTTTNMMATIGVLNLATATDATNAGNQAGQYEFVSRLAAQTGPASHIGGGTGVEEAVVKGHYLILIWAQYTNLTAGSNQAQQTQLNDFMTLLNNDTVNASLSSRMISGTPSPPPTA